MILIHLHRDQDGDYTKDAIYIRANDVAELASRYSRAIDTLHKVIGQYGAAAWNRTATVNSRVQRLIRYTRAAHRAL